MSEASGRGGDDGSHSGNGRNNQLMLVPNSPEISAETSVTLPVPVQQRQRSLQDLLRLCTQVSGPNTGSVESLDEERKQFLEQALKSLTVDVVEILVKALMVLKQAGALDSKDDPTECEEALDQILEYVDNIDFANDFQKIGGLSVLDCCLNCTHASVRWRAAHLVAELTQNNPYCQHHVLEANVLPLLLLLLDSDPNQTVRIKALYALSSLVRNNEVAIVMFQQLDGFSVLLRALQSGVEKLQVKAAFFLSALNQDNIKEELLKMGFVELFAKLLSDEVSHATEHLLSALLALVTDCTQAVAECRRPEFNLHTRLTELLEYCKDKDEYQEVCKYSQDLLTLIFEDDVEEDR